MTLVDDSVLLKRFVANGDNDAIHVLIDRYTVLVYGVCRRRTRQRESAEDATQAVFLLMCRKAPHLVRHGSLAGWLYTCADSVSRDIARKEARRMKYEKVASQETHPNETLTDSLALTLEDAMQRLSRTDRDALVLRFLLGYTLTELGNALHTNEDAARMRVQRALERLRFELSKVGITASAGALADSLPKTGQPVSPSLSEALKNLDIPPATTTVAFLRLNKGATHLMTPFAPFIAVSGIAVLAIGGATAIRSTLATPPTLLPATRSVPKNAKFLKSAPANVEAEKAIYSMIDAFAGQWSMTFKVTGFGMKELKDSSPAVAVSYSAAKGVLAIRGQESAATTTLQSYDWDISPAGGTIKIGASDDPDVDTKLHFVSSALKNKTTTLNFSQRSAHLNNKLTVTYTGAHFLFDLKSSVLHDGKWLSGETTWSFRTSRTKSVAGPSVSSSDLLCFQAGPTWSVGDSFAM